MLEITKVYNTKGEFKGLDNYKFLKNFYNEKGELIKIKKKDLFTISILATCIGINCYTISGIYSLNQSIPAIGNSLTPIAKEIGIGFKEIFNLSLSSTMIMSTIGMSKRKKITK